MDDSELEPVQQQLLSIERKLRCGQCSTALTQLRNYLHLKYHLILFKKNHLRHQAMNTRSRTTIAKNEGHVLFHSDRYQINWLALLEIEGGVVDAVGLRRLRKGDIRCMQDAETFSRKEEQKQKRLERHIQRMERRGRRGSW
ncbi:CxC2 domain-containing protein [Mycena chlorophos]|uniref:CxC2 domain-containing protein n=1 Tax=Mycena chlorophos TaxID=658473 RepID=A0A8H6VNV9_MYCCL|nr:CxC2 domain-containing protein [Mycena chlorophos]